MVRQTQIPFDFARERFFARGVKRGIFRALRRGAGNGKRSQFAVFLAGKGGWCEKRSQILVRGRRSARVSVSAIGKLTLPAATRGREAGGSLRRRGRGAGNGKRSQFAAFLAGKWG